MAVSVIVDEVGYFHPRAHLLDEMDQIIGYKGAIAVPYHKVVFITGRQPSSHTHFIALDQPKA